MDGGCDLPMLGARARVMTLMQKLGEDIGGSEDVVATYIKQKPRSEYNSGEFRPGTIAGILWLAPMPPGRSVHDYREDNNFEIGWPVADRLLSDGPYLKALVQRLYGLDWYPVWRSLLGSLTGGKPFRVDVAPYERIGAELTDYYRR